ncbi:hypothetical protein ACFL08_03570 [Patescibacteria group bacterium]
MSKSRRSPYFWLVFVASTVIVFLILVKSFLNYNSKIDVLLLPKNEKTASNITLIKNNLEYLFDGREINLSGGQKIETVSSDKNTIITFKTYSDSKQSVGALNKKVVGEFFAIASKHYNVKKDLEMRIVGKVVTNSYLGNVWLLIVISLLSGVVFAKLLFWLTGLIEKFANNSRRDLVGGAKRFSQININKFKKNIDGQKDLSTITRDEAVDSLEASRRSKEDAASAVEEIYKKHDKNDENVVHGIKKSYPPMNLPTSSVEATEEKKNTEIEKKDTKKVSTKDEIDWEERVKALKNAENIANKNVVKNKPVVKEELKKKELVPSNLPIGDDGVFEITAKSATKEEEKPRDGEPTKDEYKKRLNQLLKGNM